MQHQRARRAPRCGGNAPSLGYIPGIAMSQIPAEARQNDSTTTAEDPLRLGWRAAISFHRRLFRLAVHDLSNPLAAARLLAELARRGASGEDDVAALVDQLGVAAERLQGLRALLREAGPESFEVTAALDLAYQVVAREVERVGARLIVDLAEEVTAFLPRHLFLQATLAGLLATIESAEDGDVLVLRARLRADESETKDAEEDEPLLVVELESSVRRRRPCRAEERLCLEMLAGDLGGRFEILPGAGGANDPEWRLAMPGPAGTDVP